MKYIVETARLHLRKFTLDDAPFIVKLLNTEGWIRFIGDRNVKSTEQAVNYLQHGPLKSYQQNGFGLSLVEKKEDQQAIGMCGIIRREHLEYPDIGFAFLPAYYGNGYALEIASATIMYAKDTLAIPVIAAVTLADNVRSIRLLEKLGLQFKKNFCFPNSQEELQLYTN